MKWIIILFVIALMKSFGAIGAAVNAAEIHGIVKRPPKLTSPGKAIRRYRGSGENMPESVTADCRCNPGLFSVVSLIPATPVEIKVMADTLELSQRAKTFEPSVMAVTVNSTVSFPNLDPFYHNVFSYSKTKRFDLGKYSESQTKFVTFDRPGIVQVFCEIHYSMRAYVHVLETNYFAVSDQNGNFSIPHVPKGDYVITVWQEGQSDIDQELTVADDSLWLELE